MHVKNHMAMWILWILWILRVEYSGNPLYKPLCAFLVFVDLVWIMCGRLCGSVVLPSMPKPTVARPLARRSLWIGGLALDADACQWSCASTCPQGLRVRSTSCGLCGSVVLQSMPMPMPMPSVARPLGEGLCGSVVLPSMLMPVVC